MAEGHYPRDFPNLGEDGERTSDPSSKYNCIAYAAGDEGRHWWPGEYPPRSKNYWPVTGADDDSLETFFVGFRHIGYERCDTSDWEPGYEKVAFFMWRGS